MAETRGRTDIEVDVNLMRHMILNTLRSYRMKFHRQYGELVIACDGRKYWRRDEFAHYKAGRKKARDDSGLDWGAVYAALNVIKEELATFFPYAVIEIPGAEADDVIAALALWTQTNDLRVTDSLFDDGEAQPVLIISGDHDFMQLQRFSNVKQFSPIQRQWLKITESADRVVMEHVLCGDKGDGVPNFLSADDTFVSGGRQKPIKQADLARWKGMTREAICTTDAMLRNFDRNAKLVDLRNTPLHIQDAIIASYTEQIAKKPDRSQLLNFFIQNRMKHLIEVIGEF